MRGTMKDGVATVLVTAIVVPYIGYLMHGHVPFIQDPEGMAGVGLIVGVAAATIGGWVALHSGAFQTVLTGALALVSLGLGAATVVTMDVLDAATREALLGGFMASIVVLWALALLRHSGYIPHRSATPSGVRRV